MNWLHRRLCASARWTSAVHDHILPWVLDGVDPGDEVLEVGPGPGAATDLLRTRARQLTCVEINRALAEALAARMAGTNVTVRCEDATRLSLGDATFDTAISLTMLHHLPSAAAQDRLFAELARVLRPGGLLAGFDATTGLLFRLLHLRETTTPVDPRTLPARLARAGFDDVHVDVKPRGCAFRARRRAA